MLLVFLHSTSASVAAEMVMVEVLGAREANTSVCSARVLGGSGVCVEIDHVVVMVVVSGVVMEAVRLSSRAMMGCRPLATYTAFSSMTNR